MDCAVIYSEAALRDLQQIAEFIAADNPEASEKFVFSGKLRRCRKKLNGANGMSDIEHGATGSRAGRRQRS
jgi:plasmid stabilization system protein ParE